MSKQIEREKKENEILYQQSTNLNYKKMQFSAGE